MESKIIHAIKEQLQEERLQIHAKADTLRSELTSLDDGLLRIDAAIAALDGTSLSAQTGKTATGKQRKKIVNPTAGKSDVIKFMQSILSERGVVEEKALKALVEAKAIEAGFTRMGLSLRIKEALAEATFVRDEKGIRLK